MHLNDQQIINRLANPELLAQVRLAAARTGQGGLFVRKDGAVVPVQVRVQLGVPVIAYKEPEGPGCAE